MRSNFVDEAYPNRRKVIHNPEKFDSEEILVSNLAPEIELIARASYRLGAAEAVTGVSQHELMENKAKLDAVVKERDSMEYERNRYEQRSERKDDQIREYEAKIAKLEKKLAPKKKAAKKPAKKG